jgi:cytochrome P450
MLRRMNATIDGGPIYRALFLGRAVFECVRLNTIARAINRRATKQRRMNATIDGSPIYRASFLGRAVFECVRSNTIAAINRRAT